MPLIQSNLENALASFFDDPPETAALCAENWADAMRDYALPIVPPSTTAAAAALALSAALTPIFETSLSPSVTAIGMETAWLAFATSLGSGMAPGWVSTPPPGLIGFLALFSAPPPSTAQEAASNFSNAIHIWMSTGIAVNSTSGASVNWS
jgi:hypothetical protein